MNPCSPAELRKSRDEFAQRWHTYLQAPELEQFVEFAVAASSFSEFLAGKGLSGLHQSAHELEQHVLALFGDESGHHLSAPVMQALARSIEALLLRLDAFIEQNSRPVQERRLGDEHLTLPELAPTHQILLVGTACAAWDALMSQLAYFGIGAQLVARGTLSRHASEPAMVILAVDQLPLPAVCEEIRVLRERFAASKLLVYGLAAGFNEVKAALEAGCDHCFDDTTAHSVLLSKVIELCGQDHEDPYRVLVVEDSLTASYAAERTLRQNGMQTLAITRPQEVLQALQRFKPDLILMDMYMPDCTGVQATRVIRQNPAFLSTPVVYLSGDADVALQVDALRLGGDHFLTKPFNPVILNAVVKSKIERYRALRRAMLHDSLTNLLNHQAVKERLAQAVAAVQSDGGVLSVAMIDIDHFKRVNDQYGHPMGDQVIRSLAWLLRQRLRQTDLVGRYGGEEFLVILPGADAALSMQVLDRIRCDFGRIRYGHGPGSFTASFSGGVAQYRPDATGESLIKAADLALYQAKHQGRNQLALPADA